MKNTKKIISLVIASALVTSIVGCGRAVTGNKEADSALEAFNTIVKAFPKNKGFHKVMQHWGFKLGEGEKFEWTKDTSANKIDYAMVMMADPLIKAGVDVNKLDKNQWVYKPSEVEDGVKLPNRLVHPFNVSDKKETSNGSEDALRRVFKQAPQMIEYNKELQQYSLVLGEGFEVQWTEKMGINKSDMIFVINGDSLIKAGLDIQKLDGTGWIVGENPNQLIKTYKLK